MRATNLFKFDRIFTSNLLVAIAMTAAMHLVSFSHIKMPLFVIMCIGPIIIGATILTTASFGFWVKCLFIQSVTLLTAFLLLFAGNMTLDYFAKSNDPWYYLPSYLLAIIISMVVSIKLSRFALKSECSH